MRNKHPPACAEHVPFIVNVLLKWTTKQTSVKKLGNRGIGREKLVKLQTREAKGTGSPSEVIFSQDGSDYSVGGVGVYFPSIMHHSSLVAEAA